MLKQRLGWIALVSAVAMLAYWGAVAMTPRALMYLAMDRVGQNAPTNAMAHAPMMTAEQRTIVRPSPDLAYSTCLFDLADGPIEISVEPIDAPYWSLSVFDSRTNVVFVRNDSETDDGPVHITLARDDQTVAQDIETIRIPSDRGIALVRILLTDRGSFDEIDDARRAARCMPVE